MGGGGMGGFRGGGFGGGMAASGAVVLEAVSAASGAAVSVVGVWASEATDSEALGSPERADRGSAVFAAMLSVVHVALAETFASPAVTSAIIVCGACFATVASSLSQSPPCSGTTITAIITGTVAGG
jgi:hypothetical protein